jgi:D-alanine-D-alanine ligase-like ATP-grasp enzyme
VTRSAGRTLARTLEIADRVRPSQRELRRQFANLRREFYGEFWTGAMERLGGSATSLGKGFFRLERGSAVTYARDEVLEFDNPVRLDLAADKALVYELLRSAQIPIPAHVTFDPADLTPATRLMRGTGAPIVVKPVSGHGGSGVTTDVADHRSLYRAALHAGGTDGDCIAEQQVSGSSYRLLYVHGECVDAIRRDPPTVLGDGQADVAQLIRGENQSRLGVRPFSALRPLRRDTEVRRFLRAAGLTLSHVPADGASVPVKRVVNENAARDNHQVFAQLHPSFLELGCAITAVIPIELLGVDVITSDITAPLGQGGGVVHDINTTPALHHHALTAEQTDVASIGARVVGCLLDRHARS